MQARRGAERADASSCYAILFLTAHATAAQRMSCHHRSLGGLCCWPLAMQPRHAQRTRRAPREDLDLPRRVGDDELQRRVARLLAQRNDLHLQRNRRPAARCRGGSRRGRQASRQADGSTAAAGPCATACSCPAPPPAVCCSPQAHARAWSNRVAKRLRDVRMAPLGPRLYCFITFL